MIAGCYTLHLYCENYPEPWRNDGIHEFKEFPHEYTHEFGSVCRKEARKDGWSLNLKTGKAFWPKCSKKG